VCHPAYGEQQISRPVAEIRADSNVSFCRVVAVREHEVHAGNADVLVRKDFDLTNDADEDVRAPSEALCYTGDVTP
jgi:hypothetical protein